MNPYERFTITEAEATVDYDALPPHAQQLLDDIRLFVEAKSIMTGTDFGVTTFTINEIEAFRRTLKDA